MKISDVKKVQIFLWIVFLFVMYNSNPSIEDHRQAVMEKMKEKMTESSNSDSKNDWQKAGEAIGMSIVQGILEKAVSKDNYLLFSLTKLSFDNKEKNIGFGVLGKVWINEVDLNKIQNISSYERSSNSLDSFPIASSDDETFLDSGIDEPNDKNIKYILGCFPPN